MRFQLWVLVFSGLLLTLPQYLPFWTDEDIVLVNF